MKVVSSERPNPLDQPAPTHAPTDPDLLRELSRERGISTSVLVAARIDRESDGDHAGWWRIPYPHRTGEWKRRYRNPQADGRPKYLDDPGADTHLYNPKLLGPGEDEVWFCEGEFDTLAAIDQGYNAIGIHGTGNVPEEGKESKHFKRSWTVLFEDTLCIIAFDNDDSGRHAGRKLARGLEGDVFDKWHRDYNDLNEWHKADPAGLGVAMAAYSVEVRKMRGMA
jgi:hypothetical protein